MPTIIKNIIKIYNQEYKYARARVKTKNQKRFIFKSQKPFINKKEIIDNVKNLCILIREYKKEVSEKCLQKNGNLSFMSLERW